MKNSEKNEQLIEFIKQLKEDALLSYTKCDDVESKAAYSAQNITCEIILKQITELQSLLK